MTDVCHNKTVKYLCSYNQRLTKNVSLTWLSLIFLQFQRKSFYSFSHMVLYQNLCSAEVAILDFHSTQTAIIRLLTSSAVDGGYEHRSSQTKDQTASGSYVCKRIETKCAISIEGLPQIQFICLSVSEKTIFQKQINQKQELPLMFLFVNGSRRNQQS